MEINHDTKYTLVPLLTKPDLTQAPYGPDDLGYSVYTRKGLQVAGVPVDQNFNFPTRLDSRFVVTEAEYATGGELVSKMTIAREARSDERLIFARAQADGLVTESNVDEFIKIFPNMVEGLKTRILSDVSNSGCCHVPDSPLERQIVAQLDEGIRAGRVQSLLDPQHGRIVGLATRVIDSKIVVTPIVAPVDLTRSQTCKKLRDLVKGKSS